MVLVSFLLASALVVRQEGAELKAGCGRDDKVVAVLASGESVEIRFSMTSERGPCYKVSTGGGFTGYLLEESIGGLEAYKSAVQAAPIMTGSRPGPAAAKRPQALPVETGAAIPAEHPLARASALLNQQQPGAALEAAQRGMKTYGRSYQLLVVAGIAAQAADQPREALDYLREAQSIRSDRSVEQLIGRLEKEVAGDKSSEKLYGNRFVLRYEGSALQPDVARSIVALLEQEYSRISAELGCRTDERIATIVQTREAYRGSSDAAEWSGGHFDGSRIRIPMSESTNISPDTRQTFSHELVHACLAGLGHWPAWLHEGFAQKLTGNAISPSARQRIQSMLRAGKLPRLDNMSQSWSRMSSEHALTAYQYALVAVEELYTQYAGYGIQNVLRAPDRLPDVTARIDAALNPK